MDIITLDWETYYAKDYTLSKMTTEEYIRDPRFEPILCSFKINAQPAYWVDAPDIRKELARVRVSQNAVLAHHAHFDGLIMSHHYGVTPAVWFDTLSMARAIHGGKGKLSLAKLAERYGIGRKGTEVESVIGMRRRDFTRERLQAYGAYGLNDVELTYELFMRMLPHMPKSELKIVDMVIRMFTEPVLTLNSALLQKHASEVEGDKAMALFLAGVPREEVTSNEKFADTLRDLGVEPPTKISPTTGRETYAFAKTDPGMEELAEHENAYVRALVQARLKNKTSIATTRANRMIGMAARGLATVYLKYSGADQTHRLSGGDKMNWQNFGRGSALRESVEAQSGDEIVVGDSSNIEARVLDWLAMQDDAVEVYRRNDADPKNNPDTYCVLASRIYGRPIAKKENPDERQMGKIAKLGLGYGMGDAKFCSAVRVQTKGKVRIELPFSQLIVTTYRSTHPKVMNLHRRAQSALPHIAAGREGIAIDPRGIIKTCAGGLMLPNGLMIRYPDLKVDAEGQWSYWNGRSREYVYGGKVVENCLAAGVLVATNHGWLPIEQVTESALVYDGVDFVSHGGVVFKSVQECMPVDGVLMTPDHEVLTNEGWYFALEEPEPCRADIWRTDGDTPSGVKWEKDVMGVPLPVWSSSNESRGRCDQGSPAWGGPQLWMSEQAASRRKKQNSRYEQTPSIRGMEKHVSKVSTAITSCLQQLRRAWHSGVRELANVRQLLARYGANLCLWSNVRASEQRQRVWSGELCMGGQSYTSTKQKGESEDRHSQHISRDRHSKIDTVLPTEARPVFDIVGCGPRARFVVLGASGPFIVHNCTQAIARIIVMDQTVEINKSIPVAISVHDEAVGVSAEDTAADATAHVLECMRVPPEWAPDLPLNSEGGHHVSYGHAKA